MDVHTATISVAVRDAAGKLIMESVIETKSSTILQFIQGLRGDLYVTFEEGTWAAWLYDLLRPHVTNIVVCDPRRNALLNEGSKSDRIDARKLSELLRANPLRSVYHGENGLRTVKELSRAYLTIGKDLTRVMNRVKAIYRGWAFPAPARVSTIRAIVRNGCARSPKPACAAEQSFTTSSSTCWLSCASKRGKNSLPRARSTRPGNCSVRFRP